MNLIYKAEKKADHIHLGLVLLDKFYNPVYSFEEKVEEDLDVVERGFRVLLWALQKVKPLIKQGTVETDGEPLVVHVPARNIHTYIEETAKVPAKYAEWKFKLDTELDFMPFEVYYMYERKHLLKVKFENSEEINTDVANRALAFLETLG